MRRCNGLELDGSSDLEMLKVAGLGHSVIWKRVLILNGFIVDINKVKFGFTSSSLTIVRYHYHLNLRIFTWVIIHNVYLAILLRPIYLDGCSRGATVFLRSVDHHGLTFLHAIASVLLWAIDHYRFLVMFWFSLGWEVELEIFAFIMFTSMTGNLSLYDFIRLWLLRHDIRLAIGFGLDKKVAL